MDARRVAARSPTTDRNCRDFPKSFRNAKNQGAILLTEKEPRRDVTAAKSLKTNWLR
jgi:hypothetical protein